MHEETIFAAALEKKTKTERAAYLDAACAGVASLRRRIDALLDSHEGVGDFLANPALGSAVAEPAVQVESDEQAEVLTFLAASDKPGSLGSLGHYEVLEVIGRGGMGLVLRALDENLHRMVAIKVMVPQLSTSAAARKRFVREARATAAIRHENVINIYAVEESQPLPYLVMEYIDGISLQDRIDRTGPLELNEILRIGIQSAAGLAAAHAQGLIHRDIKPANILLENGVERVKITDFGLARAVDDASLSQSGLVTGTPQYMAPEQASGQVVDHRADLFSLGSVLYALCTGRAPFRASGTMAVLKRVCEDTPRAVRESNPEIPEWLDAIIAKLHVKDAAERFQSATEVAALLSQHLAQVHQSTQAPAVARLPSNAGPAERKGPRRHWRYVAAAVLVSLVCILTTEAAGLTTVVDFVAVVLRIRTSEGILVVEVDDPQVKVGIEGNDGIVITGAGPQKIHLRPGSYRLQASKDGKPIPLKQELVIITRGGKEIVRIHLEPPAPIALNELPKQPATAEETKLLKQLADVDASRVANPKDLTLTRKQGEILVRLNRLEEAVAAFTSVISAAPDDPEHAGVYVHRAAVHALRGDTPAAIEDYERRIRTASPHGAWPYGRVAVLYLFGAAKSRDTQRALLHAEKAMLQQDTHSGYSTLWGIGLYRDGKHRQAVQALDEAFDHKRADGRTRLNRYFAAMSYHQLGETAKAQACCAQALKLPPMGLAFGSPVDLGELARAEADALFKRSGGK